MEWADAEDGQKRWVGRVGGLGRGGFMGGVRGAQRLAEGGMGRVGGLGKGMSWAEGGCAFGALGRGGQMVEELWEEGAGGKRLAEGPGGWQRVGWTEVGRAEWVVWAKVWAWQRGGVMGLGRWAEGVR